MIIDCDMLINTCRGFVGVMGAFSVILGAYIVDSMYDNYGEKVSPVGMFFYYGGWILFACSIGLLNYAANGVTFSAKAFFGLISSVLVVACATVYQYFLYERKIKYAQFSSLALAFAWILVAAAISLPYGQVVNPKAKFTVGLIGVICIIGGNYLQMHNRKRGIGYLKSGQVGSGDSYAPGLMLYAIGWLLLAFANALL